MYIIVTRWNPSVIKVGVAYVGVHILRYLKEELVWATNKWLGLFVIYNSYTTKELRIKLFYVNIVSIVHNKRREESIQFSQYPV